MKNKICISIDEETLVFIKMLIKQGTFRNKSHAFEFAIKNLKQNHSLAKPPEEIPKWRIYG